MIGEGRASFYGNRFHGRKTASGEHFDRTDYTAAHRSLPFGTKVRVTNLSNGRHVVVKINDRGPYMKSRIIDISQAAAREIGMGGIGNVRIEAYN
ncbi:MAG: septal ring lytic transglycosylase RlpA family protein [Chlorobiaceae bacterium]|nr:septal ring lytic transglycosylase RlpA family protein [Chlorobiaceae bacterium]